MRHLLLKLAALALLLTLAACAKPIPPEKAAYVGQWTGPAMALAVSQDGRVMYRRNKDGVNTSIDAPLQEFQGDNFVVGVGPVTTVFVVSKAPHEDDGVWRMTVDGVDVTRKP